MEKLARLIEEQDTNQSRLARQTGVAQSAISEIMSGKRKPKFQDVYLLAKALNVSLDYLTDDEADSPPARLTEAERQALKMVRAMKLTEEEVIERLASDPRAFPEIKVEGDPKQKSRRA